MRIYGRQPVPYPPSGTVQSSTMDYGTYKWVVIETDADGYSDYVYITALVQCLRLVLQESPFYSQFGIPQAIDVHQQLQPDYYVNYIQSYFSQFFASLIISKRPQVPTNSNFGPGSTSYLTPIYDVSVIRQNGSLFSTTVAI